MFVDNFLNDVQTETAAFADWLGGEEDVKNFRTYRLGYPRAGIADADDGVVVDFLYAYRQSALVVHGL